MTSSKFESAAREQSSLAVIAALASVCLNNFKTSADAKEQRVLLKKTDDWKHAEFVNTAEWAKIPGVKEESGGLARSCAKMILAEK